MNWLSAIRATYGLGALVAPDFFAGQAPGSKLGDGARRAMRVLAARQLGQAGVCWLRPTRCVLTLEAVVDAMHGASMVAVAAVSRTDSTRRAAVANVVAAGAFLAADLVASRRTHVFAASPAAAPNPVLMTRDRLAESICRALPVPVGMR